MKKSNLTTIVCCVLLFLFLGCKKDTIEKPTTIIRQQTELSASMFQFPGIQVETNDTYGTYLKIDSIQALDHLERFLYNKSDELRKTWEHAIGFLSRETIDQAMLKDYLQQLTILEESLDSNQASYDTVYSQYLQLQYKRLLTAEMNKLINENGYVMFEGTMWRIDGETSYKLVKNNLEEPFPTFIFQQNDPCHQRKVIHSEYYCYRDTNSIQRDSCIDRRLQIQFTHYKNVWDYSYCTVRISQDYRLCDGGRWMPMIASTMNIYADLQYELDGNPLDPPSTRTKQENCYELRFQLFSEPGNFCIKSALIECSASIYNLSPSKLEYNIEW